MGQSRVVASREDDERVLVILSLLERGYDTLSVGQRFGYSRSYVRALRSRINRDLAESER